jgi:hypothetical protein
MKYKYQRMSWKLKQGNTAIADAAGSVMFMNRTDQEFYLEFNSGYFLLGHSRGDNFDLYYFGQYDSNLLPHNVYTQFMVMRPKDIELERPSPKKKERIFDANPLK